MFSWKWSRVKPKEQREVMNNPWRGFYTIHRFWADADSEIRESLQEGQCLCLVEINLAAFAQGKLSDKALLRIEAIFNYFSIQGREMIVRFLYDWDGEGMKHEPLHIGLVRQHIHQLKPVMLQHENAIFIHQGLFVGSWGEMHTSRHLNEADVADLAQVLWESTGEKTFIALRCPHYWRQLFKTYSPECGSVMAERFGLYNDAILASETDLGTYGDVPRTASRSYGDKLLRAEEIDFQNRLCIHVPNGGEAVGEMAKNFTIAHKTLKKMRVSYLNSMYDPDVIDSWKNTRSGIGGVFWKNRSGYDYLAAHLGYRFFFIGASVTKAREGYRVKIKLKNKGFSGSYREFMVSIVIRDSTGMEHSCPIDTDIRKWLPNVEILIYTVIDTLGFIGIRIHDPMTGKMIQFANLSIDASGFHMIGELKKRRS